MAALAICAITAALVKDRTDTQAPPPVRPDQPPPAEPGMIPLTIPEIKRLLAALTTRPLPRWLVIHWDAWTRRHQARSRWFHKRARLARDAETLPGQLAKCGCLTRDLNPHVSEGDLNTQPREFSPDRGKSCGHNSGQAPLGVKLNHWQSPDPGTAPG